MLHSAEPARNREQMAEEHSYSLCHTAQRTDTPEEPREPARPQRRRRPPSRYSPSPSRKRRRRPARAPGLPRNELPAGQSGDRRVLLPSAREANTAPAGDRADSSRRSAPSCSASAGHKWSHQQGGRREVVNDPNNTRSPPGPSHLSDSRQWPSVATPVVAMSLPAAAGSVDMMPPNSLKSEPRSIVYSKNGDYYIGEWMNNLQHGMGTYVYKIAKAIYHGEWIHGKRSGYGTYDAKLSGTGEYIRVYAGNWWNNEKDGYGTYYYSKDEYYEGYWENGQRSGYGKMKFANGDLYDGEWYNDKFYGRGLLLCGNKNIFKGFWKKGKKHGPGKFYYWDTGRFYKGIWSKDVAKCGTLQFYEIKASKAQKPPIHEGENTQPKRALKEEDGKFEGKIPGT